MHAEVVEFLRSSPVQDIGWEGVSVLEIGAQDVNGRARDYFDGWTTWHGVDLVPGDGVTFVGDAVEIVAGFAGLYDRVVSTEVLEHAERWSALVAGMVRALTPEGYLVATCASPSRPPHGVSGGEVVAPGEYYRGVSLAEVVVALRHAGASIVYARHLANPGDVQVVAQRSAISFLREGPKTLAAPMKDHQ